jgi:spermidine synthase
MSSHSQRDRGHRSSRGLLSHDSTRVGTARYPPRLLPTVILERVAVPGGELVLSKRGDELSIRLRGVELMSTRNHDSEDELGRRTAQLAGTGRVLIGGLGFGFTLRAVLAHGSSRVDVAELVPAVVRWNRTHVADHVLDDPRVTVIEDDVANVIARSAATYAAIALDVDNGPDELFEANQRLYGKRGLAAARCALTPGGALAVWSAFESTAFTARLREAGFAVEVARVKARGARHVIWLARAPS